MIFQLSLIIFLQNLDSLATEGFIWYFLYNLDFVLQELISAEVIHGC